jgi:hypothetical protein
MAAELADEPPARLQRPFHAGDDLGGPQHPVQCGIGEHGVELRLEIQRVTVHDMRIQALFPGDADHVLAGVDANDLATHFHELLGQIAVAAAEIEDALAALRPQQFHHGHAQDRNESGVLLVAVGLPVLRLPAHSDLPLE